MMGKGMFTGMVALFWLAEAAFGALVVYWFVTQGFDSGGATAEPGDVPLEDRATTLRSLAMWGGFFALLVLGIIIGA
ncbi:hypothetical protein [Halorussus sp. AFM4]|uniref:hypothetical protein n=1 Tax=Halorussus sp. AFM4 TaxID=3421651 RepID=UPI003EB8F715